MHELQVDMEDEENENKAHKLRMRIRNKKNEITKLQGDIAK